MCSRQPTTRENEMNTVTKYYADPNLSRRIIGPNMVSAAIPNSFPMETKQATPQRTQVIATPAAVNPSSTTVRGTRTANPYGDSSNVDTLKSGLAPANPYGDSSNIGALKSGLATGDCSGLDEAISSQNHHCCQDPCDSFTLSPQAMLYSVMQDMMMGPSSAYGQAQNLMNGQMMPKPPSAYEQMASMMSGRCNPPSMMPGFGYGFNSPMQAMMSPGFGMGFNGSGGMSVNFSSFSMFWGNGQF